MATATEIKTIRLAINDPQGVVNIIEIASTAELPASPAPQTAYHVTSTSSYYFTEETSGAELSDYSLMEIYLSDATLGTLIDTLGADDAECRALSLIARKLGAELRLKKDATGAESTEYTSLLEMYQYYRDIAAACREEKKSDEGTSTGRYGTSSQPTIAGGYL